MNKLFEFTGQLPKAGERITIYSARMTADQREQSLKSRMEVTRKIFGMKGKTEDLGDRIIVKDRSKSITLYVASDSFWYRDDTLHLSEKIRRGLKLPEERSSKEIALSFLKNNKLIPDDTVIYSITHTTVAIRNEGDERVKEFDTEVHVNFRYRMGGLPVFGPGAKTRVSLADAEVMSGVYQFLRKAKPVKDVRPTVTPELALELFTKNFRFAQLREDTAKVRITGMTLGYFAMPPMKVQNYLFPVYQMIGTVSTKELPAYDFKYHVVAIKYRDVDIKAMGLSIDGVRAMVF